MAPCSRSSRSLGRFARRMAACSSGRMLQILVADMSSVNASVTQQLRNTMREIGVEKELHHRAVNGNSRSWTAAAAYSSAARMSAGSRSRKSSRISRTSRPAASCPRTVPTGMRRRGYTVAAHLLVVDGDPLKRHGRDLQVIMIALIVRSCPLISVGAAQPAGLGDSTGMALTAAEDTDSPGLRR